jgi:quercetin dioxygenase-like cupin family protein
VLAEVTRDVGQSCEGIVFVINERSVEPTQLAGRTSKTLISAANGSGIITHNTAVFAEGHAPGHVHRVEDEVFFVNAGEGEVWIEGVPYGLRAGTAVHTASELVHNIHAAAPLHLLGFMVPHTVPGSYADVPPLSRDLDKPPENRASFVVYADERSVPGEPRSEARHCCACSRESRVRRNVRRVRSRSHRPCPRGWRRGQGGGPTDGGR